MHSPCTETSAFVPHGRHVFDLTVYTVVDEFTAMKSARDRGIVGPGIVPSTQAGFWLTGQRRVLPHGYISPSRGESGEEMEMGWVSELTLPHLGIPQSFLYVGSQFTTASSALHTSHRRPWAKEVLESGHPHTDGFCLGGK